MNFLGAQTGTVPGKPGWSPCSEQAALSQPADPTVVAPCPGLWPARRHTKLNDLELNGNVRGFPFLTNSSVSEPPKCHSFSISREANCSNLYVSEQLSLLIMKCYPSTRQGRHFRRPVTFEPPLLSSNKQKPIKRDFTNSL